MKLGSVLFKALEQQSVPCHASAAEGSDVYLLPEAGQDLLLQSRLNNIVYFMVSLVLRGARTCQ